MFEAPGAKKSREGAFKAGVTGAAGVRASFQAKATANGVAALTKPLFVALMREVLQEHKLKKKPPTEADLATAFTLADTNNNGVGHIVFLAIDLLRYNRIIRVFVVPAFASTMYKLIFWLRACSNVRSWTRKSSWCCTHWCRRGR